LLAVIAFALYATVGIVNQWAMRTSAYDLGIFTQIIRHYAHFQAPNIEVKQGLNAFGDHFSPALVVFAPFYRLVPSVYTLIVAQAGLVALSVVPITGFAVRRLGRVAGLAFGAAYALSYGLASLIGFQFHEVALAVPLLAFGLVALVEQRHGVAVGCLGALVFVKEDLGLTVAVAGLVLMWFSPGRRKLGAALSVWGLGWFLLATFVVIPAMSGGHGYRSLEGGRDRTPVRLTVLHHLGSALTTGARWELLGLLVLCTLALALRSPLALLLVPTLAWRLGSTNPNYWSTHYHYDAVLMPIVFLAAVDGWTRLRLRRHSGVYAAACLAVAAALIPNYPLSQLWHGYFYQRGREARAVARLLPMIPSGAVVRTDNEIAPQLVDHHAVYLFYESLGNSPRATWILTDLTTDSLNAPTAWKRSFVAGLSAQTLHSYRDGDVVLLQLTS
jgi:uncharacterized membrane protein